jgi:hypothetical protein
MIKNVAIRIRKIIRQIWCAILIKLFRNEAQNLVVVNITNL